MKSLASEDTAAEPARDLPVRARRPWDPRLYQIATLAGLLTYGVWWLDLEAPDNRRWWQRLFAE
jgi:hypothetical protein